MEDVQQIIEELRGADYSQNPYESTKGLLGKLGKFSFIGLTLHATNEFIRARPLGDDEQISTTSDLSYKPQKFNTTYQRASTPSNTMFYAGLVQPEFTPDGFLAMGRLIGLMESYPPMRDKTSIGIKRIAIRKWSNTRELHLAAIVFHNQFAEENPQTTFLYNAFRGHVGDIPELEEKSLLVTDYLASEFAKDSIASQFDYMISAIFSEICVEKGFDGIIYPSVRTIGKGLNVAIRPEFVDAYMELRSAGICTVYKNGEHTKILNDSVSTIPRGQRDLKLKPYDTEEKMNQARKLVMEQLGLG